MTTLYTVGPKGKDNGKPWLMTGNEKVARDYAQAMDGEVRDERDSITQDSIAVLPEGMKWVRQ